MTTLRRMAKALSDTARSEAQPSRTWDPRASTRAHIRRSSIASVLGWVLVRPMCATNTHATAVTVESVDLAPAAALRRAQVRGDLGLCEEPPGADQSLGDRIIWTVNARSCPLVGAHPRSISFDDEVAAATRWARTASMRSHWSGSSAI